MDEKVYRVLHIGNIANYAYNIGAILQTKNIRSDVINWDYYHVNSRPEWEELDFDASAVGDPYFPKLSPGALGSPIPDWYICASQRMAIAYLVARNDGRMMRSRVIRKLIDRYMLKLADSRYRALQKRLPTARLMEAFCMDLAGLGKLNLLRASFSFLNALRRTRGSSSVYADPELEGATPAAVTRPVLGAKAKQAKAAAASAASEPKHGAAQSDSGRVGARLPQFRDSVRFEVIEHPLSDKAFVESESGGDAAAIHRKIAHVTRNLYRFDPFDKKVIDWVTEYVEAYPNRLLMPSLLKQFEHLLPLLRRLFEPYDLIIGYGVDGIWPMVAGKKYLAYEFGTIRNIPFDDNNQGKLAFLAYRNAEKTVITNSDTQSSADALRLNYMFLPHVINEGGKPAAEEAAAFRGYLEQSCGGGDFFIFHPPRQHWSSERDTNWDKGNDRLFRGFAAFVKETGADARLIAVAWGEHVEKSRRLIASLGIEDKVTWITTQPHRHMMRYLAACDVVADQFTIKTFGGIPPKAFYLGKPVITAFDPNMHEWCFSEMPPLMSCMNAEDVFGALRHLYLDPAARSKLGTRAAEWYSRYNSNAVIRDQLARVVTETIRNAEVPTGSLHEWRRFQQVSR